jgi:hypothetical protein
MDLFALLAGIPYAGPFLPWLAVAVAFCAAVAAWLPAPRAPGWYAVVYAVVNGIGCNFGRARNAPPGGR